MLTIRPANATDATAINAIYNDYILRTSVTFDVEPWSLDKRQQWLKRLLDNPRYHIFVAEDADQVVGFAANGPFRDKAAYDAASEVSIYLADGQQGKGLGKQLLQTLLAAVADSDIHRAYAVITLPNPSSIALHEKLGFKACGFWHEVGFKFGQYFSVGLYEKRLDDSSEDNTTYS